MLAEGDTAAARQTPAGFFENLPLGRQGAPVDHDAAPLKKEAKKRKHREEEDDVEGNY